MEDGGWGKVGGRLQMQVSLHEYAPYHVGTEAVMRANLSMVQDSWTRVVL